MKIVGDESGFEFADAKLKLMVKLMSVKLLRGLVVNGVLETFDFSGKVSDGALVVGELKRG